MPKIETLEAKVIPGQDQKAEDADGNKENNGNSYAYGQEKSPRMLMAARSTTEIPTPTANEKKRMTLRLSRARKLQNWRKLMLTFKSSKPWKKQNSRIEAKK